MGKKEGEMLGTIDLQDSIEGPHLYLKTAGWGPESQSLFCWIPVMGSVSFWRGEEESLCSIWQQFTAIHPIIFLILSHHLLCYVLKLIIKYLRDEKALIKCKEASVTGKIPYMKKWEAQRTRLGGCCFLLKSVRTRVKHCGRASAVFHPGWKALSV